MSGADGPHQGQPVASAGPPPEDAEAAVVLVHGRGATARGILGLAEEIDRDGVAYLAPQAAGRTWYPNSFLAPRERNQPGIDSGLAAVGDVLGDLDAAGVPPERTLLAGFSQGACLALEYAARDPRRYGGVAGLSGGLIGETLDSYEGSMAGTPVFLGCSDDDPHIPVERVHETAAVFGDLGAEVDERIYEGMGHGVSGDELDALRGLVDGTLD